MRIDKSYSYYYNKIYNKVRHDDFDSLRDFVKACPVGSILEIGAGAGRILEANLKCDLYLLDKDPSMLELLREKTKNFREVTVLDADACNIPLEDNSIAGCCITMATIHEINPVFFILSEIKRVLKDGGLIYLLVINPKIQRPGTQGLVRKDGIDEEYALFSAVDMTHLPYGYEVEFRISTSDERNSFFIKQTRPPIEIWKSLITRVGFEITSMTADFTTDLFDEKSSSLATIIAQKSKEGGCDVIAKGLCKRYDEMSDEYDNVIEKYNYSGAKWITEFAGKYRPRFPKILDLGCGNGLCGKVFNDCNKLPAMYGIDFSIEMVKLTKVSPYYVSVVSADLSKGLPVVNSRFFDIVTSFGVLEFVQYHERLLKEIRDSLHVGGEFWGTFEKGEGEFYDKKINITKYRYPSIKSVATLLTNVGFEILELKEQNAFNSPAFKEKIIYFVFRLKRTNI